MELPWWLPFGDVPTMGAEELADRLRRGRDHGPLVLDVRTRREFEAGHIPWSTWAPVHEVVRRPEEVVGQAGDRPIVVVCFSGHRGTVAARALARAGGDARALSWGMLGWWRADYPTLTGDAAPESLTGSPVPGGSVDAVARPGGHRRALEALVGAPFVEGNDVRVLRNGVEIFPAMLEAIRSAQHSVDILTFVYWTGEPAHAFATALSERAAAGVRVRVLLDAYGASKMPDTLVRRMRDAGCRVEFFRPVFRDPTRLTHRTHRKVLVCDGRIGFTGGVGIAEEWAGDARHAGEWRDTHFRIEGPAVIGLRAGFVSNWIETGAALVEDDERFPELEPAGDAAVQVLRSQPAAVGRTDVELVLRAVVRIAQRRLRLATAYFTPDRPFLRLLRDAARRGVEVEVLVPGPHIDKRFVQLAAAHTHERLLEAGVRIHRFQPSMFHTKVLLVDDELAVVGSANLNSRSMAKDDELCLVTDHGPTVATLHNHFDDDLRRSEPLDLADWEGRGFVRRWGERALQAVRPQL